MKNALTNYLTGFTASLDYSAIPQDVVSHARLMLADTIAVALAAESDEVTPLMRKYAASEQGQCVLWGSNIRTTARNAALVNGAMAHALDFDDNNMSMIGHPSAPVAPAVLALADEVPVSLADVLVAYIAGVQIESVFGRVAGLRPNNRGWHTISTYGSFASAGACARLLKLDEAQVQHALCLAASLAGGLRENFPEMTKPVHAGFGAQNGVLASRLAAVGVRAVSTAIEGPEGFLQLFAGVDSAEIDTSQFDTFEVRENFAKVYPTCAMVHQALDLVLDGMHEGRIQKDEVEKIEIETSYHALQIMHYPDPQDVPEARFSWEYCLAVALAAGEVTNEWFAVSRLQDPTLRAIMKKVRVRVRPIRQPEKHLKRCISQVAPAHALRSPTRMGRNSRTKQPCKRDIPRSRFHLTTSARSS
jgi:2-methylcitrate dehydratase PrpD